MGVLDIIYPAKCAICGSVPEDRIECVCKKCEEKLVPIRGPVCPRCGRPVYGLESVLCGECENREFLVSYGRALYLYDEYMKKAIANFKFKGDKSIGVYFAKKIIKKYGDLLSEREYDAIIPVPVHKNKLRYRGFNQALIMAEVMGNELGIEVDGDILIRTKDTKPQKSMTREERFKNLQSCFEIKKYNKIYRKVLLVDDIYTTGATMEGCAVALRKAGIKDINFMCLCIGSIPQE